MHPLLVTILLASAPAPAPAAAAPAAPVARPGAPTAEPKVGEAAPEFALPADDGTTFTLSQAKKPVAIAFYPRAFTGGCTKQMAAFAGAKDALAARGATVVAVSTDALPEVRKFKESLGATFPFLSDDDASVAQKYGVYVSERNIALRVTFVVGADGRITHVERDRLDPEGVLASCPLDTKGAADGKADGKKRTSKKSGTSGAAAP